MSADATSNWIACAAELPPLDLPVWLWFGQGKLQNLIIGCRALNGGDWFWCNCYGAQWWDAKRGQWDAGDAEMDDDYKPTHWLPLPTPPSLTAGETAP